MEQRAGLMIYNVSLRGLHRRQARGSIHQDRPSHGSGEPSSRHRQMRYPRGMAMPDESSHPDVERGGYVQTCETKSFSLKPDFDWPFQNCTRQSLFFT